MQSTQSDSGIYPIYQVVYRLYHICDFSTQTNGIVSWSFKNPDARHSVGLQECLRSFDHFQLPYFYRVESELFDKSHFTIECSMRKIWDHIFDIATSDRLCEAISPRRSPRKRSSASRNKDGFFRGQSYVMPLKF
nr:MAG TPA: hypothetical protein [Microviridae sp.]